MIIPANFELVNIIIDSPPDIFLGVYDQESYDLYVQLLIIYNLYYNKTTMIDYGSTSHIEYKRYLGRKDIFVY